MRLLVDGRWRGRHGIGRFAEEVLCRLPVWRELPLRGSHLSPLDPWRVARAIRRLRPEVYFSPGFNAPLGLPERFGAEPPVVFCVHDLIYAHFPLEATWAKRLYFERVVRPAGLRARAVLTVSEHVKRELVSWGDWDASRVVVVGNGVSAAFRPGGERLEPGYPYLLYVGARKPHKNLSRLFTAVAQSRLPGAMRLLLTGAHDAGTVAEAQARGLDASRLAFLGEADDARLASAYRGAAALVIPSLEEGFGLPAVEAMACGAPVVAAETGALPEVAGGAAVLVDPVEVGSIGAGLERVVGDAALRERLRVRGLERSLAFSWDAVARRVAGALGV